METKTTIEDTVAKKKGGNKKVLPKYTTIRFEMGDIELICTATEGGLEIIKRNVKTGEPVGIIISGGITNRMVVK